MMSELIIHLIVHKHEHVHRFSYTHIWLWCNALHAHIIIHLFIYWYLEEILVIFSSAAEISCYSRCWVSVRRLSRDLLASFSLASINQSHFICESLNHSQIVSKGFAQSKRKPTDPSLASVKRQWPGKIPQWEETLSRGPTLDIESLQWGPGQYRAIGPYGLHPEHLQGKVFLKATWSNVWTPFNDFLSVPWSNSEALRSHTRCWPWLFPRILLMKSRKLDQF